jgi:hypothetical protein
MATAQAALDPIPRSSEEILDGVAAVVARLGSLDDQHAPIAGMRTGAQDSLKVLDGAGLGNEEQVAVIARTAPHAHIADLLVAMATKPQ